MFRFGALTRLAIHIVPKVPTVLTVPSRTVFSKFSPVNLRSFSSKSNGLSDPDTFDGYANEYAGTIIFRDYLKEIERLEKEGKTNSGETILDSTSFHPSDLFGETRKNKEHTLECMNVLTNMRKNGQTSIYDTKKEEEYAKANEKLPKEKEEDKNKTLDELHDEYQTSIKSILYDILVNSKNLDKSDKKEIRKLFDKKHWGIRLDQCLSTVDELEERTKESYYKCTELSNKIDHLENELEKNIKFLIELAKIKVDAEKVCEDPKLFEYHKRLFNETRDNQEFWNKHRYDEFITKRLEWLLDHQEETKKYSEEELEELRKTEGYHVLQDWLEDENSKLSKRDD